MSITGKFFNLSFTGEGLSKIIKLDQEHFPRPWSESDWLKTDPQNHLLYAWQNRNFEAFALFQWIEQDETAHLLKICLLPEKRGGELAALFWSEILKDLKLKGLTSVYLEVESENLRALKFYQKVGFKTLREVKSYYSDGSAARMMSLML